MITFDRIRFVVPALLMSAVAMMLASMDMYLPCAPYLVRHFDTTEHVMQVSLMISPFISSFVGIFYGYFGDKHGRRKAILITIFFFSLGSMMCALSTNIHMFLFSRFIQAIGGGGISVVALVILSDLFSGVEYAKYVATYGIVFPTSYALAPIIGARFFRAWGWPSIFWFLGTVPIIIGVALYFILPETHLMAKKKLDRSNLGGKLKQFISSRRFMTMTLGHSLPVILLALYITNSSFIFIDHFHLSPVEYSHLQLVPMGINILSTLTYRSVLSKFGMDATLKVVFTTTSLFAATAFLSLLFNQTSEDFIILSMVFLNAGLCYSSATCATCAYETFIEDKALAVAFVSFIRNGLLSIIVTGTSFFYNGTIVPVFTCMIILSLATLPFLRGKTSYSPSA
ncbi:MAG: MFS transporter [Alphaproteobacteria bacterium]|nr:MFS transporter [Alphaproteobacteria bacterium]